MNKRLKAKVFECFGLQVDFAAAIGVSDSQVSRIIRGRRTLSDEEKSRWAAVLGCNPEDLFS